MPVVLDILTVAVILIGFLLGVKKGFARMIIEVVGILAAVALAFLVSTPIANGVYGQFLEQPVSRTVDNMFVDYAQSSINDAVDGIWNSDPMISNLASLCKITPQQVKEGASGAYDGSISAVSDYVKLTIIKPALVLLLRIAVMLMLTVLLMLLIRPLAKLVNKAFSFSVIGKLNGVLGGVLGLINGSIFAALFCSILYALALIIPGGLLGITGGTLEKTIFFKVLTGLFG